MFGTFVLLFLGAILGFNAHSYLFINHQPLVANYKAVSNILKAKLSPIQQNDPKQQIANLTLNYIKKIQTLVLSKGEDKIREYQPCAELLPLPETLSAEDVACVIVPSGDVAFSGLDEGVKKKMITMDNVHETEKGNIIISSKQEQSK